MERAEKQAEVESLSGRLEQARIALTADYRGLTVAEITELRKQLRETGSVGRVVKNTLAKISAQKVFGESEGEDLQKFLDVFEGPSMLVTSEEDAVSPTKVLTKFAKEHEALTLKGGWFDGGFIDDKGLEELSKLPSREELLAKLLSVISAPATQVVQLMQAPGSQLVRTLEAHRANIEKGA
jgi:large subunit ribosomal protein L10